jgi:hypothetical protein
MPTSTKSKKQASPVGAEPFAHDAVVIRTSNSDDTAWGGFQWPSEVGSLVEAPDWDPRPKCGYGLHGLLDGIGAWGLTDRDSPVWQVVGVKRDECVWVEDDKVKFPRCVLLYRGDKAGALKLILPDMIKAIMGGAEGNTATGDRGHAAATGDRGHAAATGDCGHAAATGDRGHAAATGYSGHAAATGYSGHAAATGDRGIAASLGIEGSATAGPAGAIMLAHWDTSAWPYKLSAVGAFMVGSDGVEPGKTYRLSANGKPVEVLS